MNTNLKRLYSHRTDVFAAALVGTVAASAPVGCAGRADCAESRSCPGPIPSADAEGIRADASVHPREPSEGGPVDSGGDSASDSGIVCPNGFADCNQDPGDGCEANLLTDPDHCGSCEALCSDSGTSARTCARGLCRPVCDSSHLDCDGDGADGCEVPIDDADHCGSCTHVCDNQGTASRACAGGVCKPACDAGHLDCNDDPDDGCEVDILTDPNNCGACGHGCSLSGTTARACVGGTCNPTCTGNSGDCRTPAASEADDGCETNLLTNPTSCGVCGHDCLEGLCVSARCQPAELVVGVSLSGPLAVDSQYVHWIEGNVIARTPISGVGALPVAQGQDNAFAITSDGTYVFWFRENTASAVPFNGFIMYMKSGTTDFHSFLSRLKPAAIAADGTNLYWVDQIDGKIHQAARDGTGVTTISPVLDGLMSLATDGVSVFAGLSGSTVVGLASVPVGGGTLVETAALTTTPMIEPVTLSLDATHVYSWGYDSTAHHTVLLQMPKTLQGNPIPLAPSTSDNFLGIAAGQKFVYFAQPDGIYRIPASGGTPTFLAPSNRPVTSLALSNGALYWIDPPAPSAVNGRVMKLAVFEDL